MEKMEIEDEKNSKENKYTAILATLEDIPEINNIIISFWGKNSIYDNNFYIRVLKHNLSYAYKIDKEMIAICLIDKNEKEKIINISLLCVKKAYQRAGYGKSLLDFCIKNCEKNGYKDFYLNVATTNSSAIKLYEKLGFKKIKTILNYYHLDKPPDNDAYLMVKGNIKFDKNKNYDYYHNYQNKNSYEHYNNHRHYNNNYEHYNNHNYNRNDHVHYNNHRHHHNDYQNNYNNDYYGHYNNYYNNYPNNYYNNYNNHTYYNNYSDYREGYWRRYNERYK